MSELQMHGRSRIAHTIGADYSDSPLCNRGFLLPKRSERPRVEVEVLVAEAEVILQPLDFLRQPGERQSQIPARPPVAAL
jgi:hypothetical protein